MPRLLAGNSLYSRMLAWTSIPRLVPASRIARAPNNAYRQNPCHGAPPREWHKMLDQCHVAVMTTTPSAPHPCPPEMPPKAWSVALSSDQSATNMRLQEPQTACDTRRRY